MSRHKRPKNNPEISKEAAEPEPEQSPHVSRGEKGEPSSRLEKSQEPGEDEERRRVAGKLRKREQESRQEDS
jgi:hypothetical protein